jgi:ketosteroid isomerase-like protein
MVGDEVVVGIARSWDEGWNERDVERIMDPFADDVLFTSPGVAKITGDPAKASIQGADALRQYVIDALERAGDVRYTLHQALAGTDSVVLVYTCHLPGGNDRPGADLLRVEDGKVAEWRCHYATDPTTWR